MKLLKSFILLSTFLLMVLVLPLCTGDKTTQEENSEGEVVAVEDSTEELTPAEDNSPKPVDRKFDDLARLIAGLEPNEGSTYQDLCETPAWKQYAQNSDAQWANINQNKVPVMSKWSQEELQAPNQQGGLVFYPFSGPDFLHVSTFFPNADQIVMVGLEPIGDLPDMEAIGKQSLGAYLNGIQQSLYNILNHSFFRTISMAQDFTGKRVTTVDGTLHTLMLFMARTDHKVLYYEKVAVDPAGKIVPADQAQTDSTYYGTKIAFQKNSEPDSRKYLYYFQANLQDTPYTARSGLSTSGLAQHTDFRKYLESLDINATYLKSASYLMYRETFSIVRNLILDKSQYLLQDDSGMPIKYIDQEKWNLTFYGNYVAPINLFKNRYQQDLRSVYAKGEGVKPLPFGIGYQYVAGTSNLMLGVKK